MIHALNLHHVCLGVTCSICHTSKQAKLYINYMYVLRIIIHIISGYYNLVHKHLFIIVTGRPAFTACLPAPDAHVRPCSLIISIPQQQSFRVALLPQFDVFKLSLLTWPSSLSRSAGIPAGPAYFTGLLVPPLVCAALSHQSKEPVAILISYRSDFSTRLQYRTVVWDGC